MLIDWFTVIAQALNFLVLVWLLKRFAYRPILEAINRREQGIAAQLAAAASAQAAAAAEREAFRARNEELAQHRAQLLDQATQEAKVTRTRLLEQARQDADAERAQLLAVLRTEQAALKSEMCRRVGEEVLAISRRTISDLAHEELDDTMVKVFLERLRQLGAADRRVLLGPDALSAGITVRSAFELPPQMRAGVESAVAALGVSGGGIRFETAPELVCGVELLAAGHKLAWSVDDFLGSLEAGIDRILEADVRSAVTVA